MGEIRNAPGGSPPAVFVKPAMDPTHANLTTRGPGDSPTAPSSTQALTGGPTRAPDANKNVRRLIWLYFWLLMLEGAVRKWGLPRFAGPLLIIRDPVLIYCYAEALRRGCFPKGPIVSWIAILGGLTFLVSVAQIQMNVVPSTFIIACYGLHTNFLHLPLIFLMGNALDRADVEKIGKWLLVLSIPMAALVYLQFHAGSSDWINVGAGVGSEQIGAAVNGVEKIRPAGLFSYNTGLSAFLSLSAAFVLYGFFNEKVFSPPLVFTAMCSIAAAVPLSISRTNVLRVGIVCCAAILCGMIKPRLYGKSMKIAVVAGVTGVGYASWSILSEGMGILTERFAQAEGFKVGILQRVWEGIGIETISSTPLWGFGLGMGTNVASGFLHGQRSFLLAEAEWPRVLMESGPLLGAAFIVLRLMIAYRLGTGSWSRLQAADTLPLLLLSASGLALLNGQFGQPTELGFAVFGSGLCLAATRAENTSSLSPQEEPQNRNSSPALQRGRSVYAERLHGSP